MAYTNQCTRCIDAKFGWEKGSHKETLYQSLIGSFAVGAMMIGSPIGGKLIAIGRLKTLDIAAMIGIIGVGLTLI